MEELENRVRELENDLVKEARVRYKNEIELHKKLDSAIALLKSINPYIARLQREKIRKWFNDSGIEFY